MPAAAATLPDAAEAGKPEPVHAVPAMPEALAAEPAAAPAPAATHAFPGLGEPIIRKPAKPQREPRRPAKSEAESELLMLMSKTSTQRPRHPVVASARADLAAKDKR
jgi:hypothetical protein